MQLSRLSDGKRKVTSIAEITGWKATSSRCRRSSSSCAPAPAPTTAVIGHFQATGVRPRFLNDLLAMGIKIPGTYFDPSQPL